MLLNRKISLVLTGLCLLFATAVPAQPGNKNKGAACSMLQEGRELSWKKMTNVAALKLPAAKGTLKLPTRYSVYTIDGKGLHALLTGAKSRGTVPTEIVLPLADEAGCVVFSAGNSGTMSPELAAKYPQLVSLKGIGTEDKSASLRLDYDGREMNAEIRRKGIYYIIAPWKKGSRTYYLVYRKEDSGVKRASLAGE